MALVTSKQSLIDTIMQENLNISAIQVQKAIETIFDEIATALVCGDRVEVRGFGSFVVRKRDKGVTRNPKSGERVEIEDRGSLYFRASKELIRDINFSSDNDN
jgi:integration host factor subunit beta